MAPFWKEIVAEKKQRQQAAIPKEWILTNLPSEEILDVTMFPESSGLLSTKDIEFTNSSVEILLEKLANGTWSSVEVTTAFSKRAVIAHQLVSSQGIFVPVHRFLSAACSFSTRSFSLDELPNGNIHRSGPEPSCRA